MPDSSDNKWVGYMFTKRATNDGVLMEIWQDNNNNQWELVNSSWGIDPGRGERRQLPSDHQITFASGPVRETGYKKPLVQAPKPKPLSSLSEQLEKLK